LVARCVRDAEVVGSNPATPTTRRTCRAPLEHVRRGGRGRRRASAEYPTTRHLTWAGARRPVPRRSEAPAVLGAPGQHPSRRAPWGHGEIPGLRTRLAPVEEPGERRGPALDHLRPVRQGRRSRSGGTTHGLAGRRGLSAAGTFSARPIDVSAVPEHRQGSNLHDTRGGHARSTESPSWPSGTQRRIAGNAQAEASPQGPEPESSRGPLQEDLSPRRRHVQRFGARLHLIATASFPADPCRKSCA
jgi:hypothetical protein